MKFNNKAYLIILISFFFAYQYSALAQELYSAKGYWVEQNKETYRKILDKKLKGDSISIDESTFLEDYIAYLENYYQRMSEQ